MIGVKLKCACTDGEVELQLRERNEDEDIRDYMEYVQLELGLWHQHRGCPRTSLEYMKMPVAENKPLGVR